MNITVDDVIQFRQLSQEEYDDDAWGDERFFAGQSFKVVKYDGDKYWLYCEELPMPMGCFDKSFFDEWDEGDFTIIPAV